MVKKIVVVESPNKAREFMHMDGIKGEFTVKATVGHFCDLPPKEMGMEVDGKKVSYRMVPQQGKETLIRSLIRECSGAEVYVATDNDREGEAIAYHFYKELEKASRSGKITKPRFIRRMRVEAITEKEFFKALRNAEDLNLPRALAGVSRRLTDRWYGYSLSGPVAKALGLNYGQASVGRTQSAALRIVYDREKEIKNFKPEEYFKIVMKDDAGTEFATGAMRKKEDAQRVLAALLSAPLSVVKAEIKKARENPPKPLTAVVMQQMMAKGRKWSSKRTMDTAQKLFEQGLISYHRTDSVRVSPETQEMVLGYLKSHFPKFAPQSTAAHKNKSKVQDAHECIHPTELDGKGSPDSVRKRLSSEEGELYSIIHSVFLASQSVPALWDVTDIEVSNGKSPLPLKARGRRLVFEGWRHFDKEKMFQTKDKPILKEYRTDDPVKGTPAIKNDWTKPPARYNESTLLKDLEKNGIGRPATYADIFEKLFRKEYMKKDRDGTLNITPFGEKQTELLLAVCPEIVDIKCTAEMEEELDKVELNEMRWEAPILTSDRVVKEAMAHISKIGITHYLPEEMKKSLGGSRYTSSSRKQGSYGQKKGSAPRPSGGYRKSVASKGPKATKSKTVKPKKEGYER